MAAGATASVSKEPKTIYEMLLWLYGLGQDDKTSEKTKLETYIGTTLKDSLNGNFTSHTSVSSSIQKVTAEANKLVQNVCSDAGKIIVGIQNGTDYSKQKAELPTVLEKLKKEAEWKTFEYPSEGKKLYDQFLRCVYCCLWQLRFLCLVCSAHAEVGGWGQCYYGKDAPESSDACKKDDQQNHEQRCQRCSKDSGCLQAFITAQPNGAQGMTSGNNTYTGATYNGSCTQDSGTSSCPIPPMGFPKEKLPSNSKQGIELYNALIDYFKTHNNNFPKLLGYLLALDLLQHNASSSKSSSSTSLQVPSSWKLPHIFAFWAAFRGKWSRQKTVWQQKFQAELNGNGNGTKYQWKPHPGKPYDLLDALFNASNSNHQNNNENHNGLSTLTNCAVNTSSPSTHCGKYFHGLLEQSFEHLVEEFKTGGLFGIFMNHETIREFANKFYNKFQEFKGKLQNQPCVKENQCQCIVFCDLTHSFMYQNGFTFHSPLSLAVKKKSSGNAVVHDNGRSNAQKRKCSDLLQQLEHVLSQDAPLDKLTKLEKDALPRLPLTIREMLLWLYALGQSDKSSQKDQLQEYIEKELTKNLTSQPNVSSVTNEAKTLIKEVCKEAGHIIVSIQKGQNNTNTGDLNQELQNQPFTYEKEDKKLYDQFLYYLTACYWQLRFLYTVCGANSAVGGWAGCRYGKSGPHSSDQCKKDQNPNHKDRCTHCSKDYRGCLMGFLTEGSEGNGGKDPNKNIYTGATYNGQCPDDTNARQTPSTACPLPPMGFPQNTLPSSSKQGSDIQTKILKDYIGDNSKNFPKLLGHLKLLELLSTMSSSGSSSPTLKVPGSWNVSDLWALFYQLYKNGTLKNKLTQVLKQTHEQGFQKKDGPTQQDKPDYNDLSEVFTKLLFQKHSSSPHPSCLLSLCECDGGVGPSKNNTNNHCGKYLYSLFSDAFHHVLHWFTKENNISLLTFEALKELAKELKDKLETFKQELEKKDCVRDSSQCQCIVFCDDTHAFLYRNGFTFMSPKGLAVMKTNSDSNASQDNDRSDAQKRKCSDLKSQLEIVTKENSALDVFSKLEKYVPPRAPFTIYEMLLWLHGLTQSGQKGHKDRLEEYIYGTLKNSLTQRFPSVTAEANKAKTLVDKVSQEAGEIIVSIQKGEKYDKSKHSSVLDQLKEEISKLKYPDTSSDNGQQLYAQFVYYMTCCYWQLRFLQLKCYTQSGLGGWGSCNYGNGVQDTQCSQHTQRCQTCSSTYKGCLQAFLTEMPQGSGDQKSTDSQNKNIYKDAKYSGNCNGSSSGPCTIPPMGFPTAKLPSDSKSGSSLKTNALDPYFNDHTKNFPELLSMLKIFELLSATSSTSSSTALTVPQHWGLPELFAFWNVFRQKWSGKKAEWEKKFQAELQQGQGVTYEWRTDPGSPYQLLEALFKTYGTNPSQHASQNHNSLLTLTDCQVNNGASTTCGKYFHGLLEKPFEHILWRFQNGQLFASFMNHETIKTFAEKFREKFQAFKGNLQTQTCVTENKCTCIVYCDDTHAFLYQNGLTLNSSMSLNTLQRKCSDLKSQLQHVLSQDAPLWKLTQLGKEVKPPTTPKAASQKAAVGSTSSSGLPSGTQQAPVSPAVTGSDAHGQSSQSAVPPAPPAPPPGAASQASTPTAPNSSGGQLRSDSGGGNLQLSVQPGQQAVVPVQTPQPQAQAQAQVQSQVSSQPPSSPGGTTPSTTPPTGTPGSKGSPGTGTVLTADNNRDGVALLSTFKNSFDGVLKQLTSTFNKVSKSAIDAIGTTSQYILKEINAHHSSLLEPPCNVKECLEWLDRVCTNGNKDCQCQSLYNRNSSKTQQCKDCMALDLSEAVNAILPGIKDNKSRGSNNTVQSVVREASALFNAIKGPNYQPAYKLSAKWPTCGPATGGAQCRGCQKTDCQCSTASSPCDGTCCHRCDVRVCAGIFIAMVPALDKALRELRDKLQKGNNGTKNINQSPVVEFLKHLGYEEKDLNTTTKGSSLPARLITPIAKLGQLSRYIKNLFEGKNLKGKNNSTPPCYFQAAKGSNTATTSVVSPAVTPSTDPSTACSTPGTVREMLLWLMGLPYCEGYKQFVEKLKDKYNDHNKNLLGINSSNAKTGASSAQYYLHRQYSLVIFQLPVLFFTVEADVSYLRDTFCQFAPEHNRERLKKILNDDKKDCNNHVRSFQYPCAGDKLCAMFYDYTYKVHLQLRFLLTMCNTEQSDGGWKHCRYIAAPAATSSAAKTGAQECCSEHNLLCNCTTQRSRSTTVSNSCRQLLREFLRDCRKEDPIKGVNQDPKKGANKDPKNCPTHSSNAADHSSNDPVTRNIFKSPCSGLHGSMGFRVPECDHTPVTSCTLICHYTGDEIKGVLSGLVDPAQGPSHRTNNYNGSLNKPLSVVTQWMIALQGQEPRSLGDILDLFRELCVGSNRTNASTSALAIRVKIGNNGQERKKMSDVLLEQLGAMLLDKYADYLSKTGAQTGAEAAKEEVAKIQGALYDVLDVWHHRSTTQRHTAQTIIFDPNLYSLIAIMGGCHTVRNNTCTAYIKSLSYGLYHYYSPEFNTQANGDKKMYSDHVLDWLFRWCTALYKGLKELKKRITERCNCCLEASKRNDSECTSIVSCCKCPPELYRCALVLGDPKTLIGNGRVRKTAAKKCSDFIDSVTKVLLSSAPLFRACEALMTVVYHVLLMASKNRVYTHIVNLEPKEKDAPTPMQRELIVAFHRYVASAMHCSKKKLMETFLRPLCEHYQCEGCDDECPKRDVEVSVSASSVTTITAVIPKYTAPVIDRYHYRVMTKIECCEDCKGKKCTEGRALCCDRECSFVDSQVASTQGTDGTSSCATSYDFRSALDFHVRGANCILPVPSNLRSVIDWILRVTTGAIATGATATQKDKDNGKNEMIQHLSEEVQRVLKECGVAVTDDAEAVQKNVTDLVQGLRTFMGYQERSTDVITQVKEEKNSVTKLLEAKIAALNNFIGNNGSAQFPQELGTALQKAMFTVAQNDNKSDKKTLKCVVEDLQGKLTEKHNGNCELKCNDFKPKYGRARVLGTVLLPEGLSELCDFFDHLQYFAKEWDSIGMKTGTSQNPNPSSSVVHTQKTEAMNELTYNGSNGSSSSNNTEYFNKLYQALTELGNCAQKVQALENKNNGNGVTDSKAYRTNISALITGLNAFNTALNGSNSNIADPVYAVNGAQELIKLTKSRVECFVTNRFRDGAEAVYCIYAESGLMRISKVIKHLGTSVQNRLSLYQSHLDDLKRLCQWLYRMGQLYASGLKGFVESLVKHLEHIIEVIKWIEKLKVFMNIVMNSNNAEAAEVQQSITAGASTIAKLLSSYVLSTSSDIVISDDNASKYRGFLSDLRLLALDRYTLQVWQDECNPNDSRQSAIKDWITFENGVIRHSAVGDIKQKLSELTGIAFDSNASSAPSPSAPPSASHRIHDFHAICVLQKFSFEAPIKLLEESLEKLKGIQGQLSAVKGKCNNGGALQDDQTVKEFCTTVTEFLSEPYGIYSFAKFVHTILGPNVFSAVIGALEELKDKDQYKNNGGNLEQIKGILEVMTEGLDGEKDQQKKEHYKLEEIIKKLTEFIATLRKEYIFSYPVVCGIELEEDCNTVCPGECDTQRCDRKCYEKSKDASLACSSQSSVTPSLTSATSTSPMPPLCAHCHLSSSICPECIPLLSRIFITLVPVLYPQLCYLAYQCRLYWQQDHMNGYRDSALSSLMRTFGFESKDLYDYLYVDVPFSGTHIDNVLCREENSLRLLCHDISTDFSRSPFNKNSPLCQLYTLCLQYYRCRRSQSLTDAKSTPPVMPTTVRQILRFFVYLPFSSQFQSLQEVLRCYCSQSCVVHYADLFATLMMSSAMSAVLLQLIECPQGEFLCFFDDIYTNKEGLYFGNNTETLFYQLCDLSVTLYRGLKFLSLQCGTERSFAGWKDCRLRGVKRNNRSDDISQVLDPQQLQLCAPHLCECQSIGAEDSSTTAPMCLNSDSSVATQGSQLSTPTSHTTSCSLPLLRYLTDANCFFDSRVTVPRALRKVCLNDSCQEMVYRHMAPRGWPEGALQCTHKDEQQGDRQLEVCDPKACYSACHSRDSDLQRSDRSKCHPRRRTQCCGPVCSTLYGHDLFHVLRNFVGHEHDADPLLQFTRYMVAIAAWPPDSLSGYMTFMLRFGDQLRKEERDTQRSVSEKNASQKKDWNSSVLSSLRSEITLFPGEFDPNCLIEAFVNVTHCEHNNGVAHTPVASPSTDTASSFSPSPLCTTSTGVTISVLRDCKDCKCIIYPLDYEIYDLYLPMYARRYLTWMLHFGPRLHRGMRALEKEFKRHIRESSVAQSGVCSTDPGATQSVVSSQGCSHSSIVQCPFALPELHAAGLHFWDPNRMCNEKNKISCKCFVDTLQCSIQDSSPLAEFLRQCDSFLWSVRKPFYWLTMALWIVATVYLLFVHFWRLDLARLLSHVIRSRASHLVYPKVLLAAELDHRYEQYYAPR